MNQPVRLPMRPTDVIIRTLGGREFEGTIFLAAVAPTHGGPETIGEFLASPRGFIPVKVKSSGLSMFLRRSAILFLSVEAPVVPFAQDDEPLMSIDLIRLDLEDGAFIEGVLADAGQRRLSDHLNKAEPFLAIADGDRIAYVNRDRIISVSS